MRAALFVGILALSGCASMDVGPSAGQLTGALNSRFADRPVSEMIARYGQPETAFEMPNGIRVAQWSASTVVRLHENVTATTTGAIGDRSIPGLRPIPYGQTTTTRQGYDEPMSCVMQAGFRADNTVERVGLGGKLGACDAFAP
jgi:hypothetical protein